MAHHPLANRILSGAGACLVGCLLGAGTPALAADEAAARAARHAAIVAHWTPERRKAAIPRDLRIDPRGLGYLRHADGTLVPYGHSMAALAPEPRAKPGGSTDSTPPAVTGMDPGAGAVIGASYAFKATVTDASGVRSVSFVLRSPTGQTQTVSATQGANNLWSATLSGFTDGNWAWSVVAKDASRAGNTTTTAEVAFTVGGGGGGGGGGGVVTNARWIDGGTVQTAAGRILFEMPANARRTRWSAYVCSGTVVYDAAAQRSLILTAAHCVYDDAYKAFARNVLFIPDQDGTTGTATDRVCTNDPLGCWTPAFGVVDDDWTSRTFPDNIPWDYAFYVVPDEAGAHSGTALSNWVLDSVAGHLTPQFTPPVEGDTTHALGYSYSDDPNFMYCAEAMGTDGTANWWLPGCELSGGASGGPWLQPVSAGNGPVISVNSWGYTNSPGMAGPRLHDNSAQCLYTQARTTAFAAIGTGAGNQGIAPPCP